MNTKQAIKYQSLVEGYKTDPRWVAAMAVMADPASEPDEYAWAQARASELERSARRSAEQARMGGL
jgi:hypothetical protein